MKKGTCYCSGCKGPDFPDEYKGSEDTMRTRGPYAKAKANAIQGIEGMIEIARKTKETENYRRGKCHYTL